MVVTDFRIYFLFVYIDDGCIIEFLWDSLLHAHALKHDRVRNII